MSVPNYIPHHLPLIVGTAELGKMIEDRGRRHIEVIEPPIDVELNRSCDVASARANWSFEAEEIVLSIVCRMTTDLQKLEGVLEAMRVIGALATNAPLRFLVVGGGQGLDEVKQLAEEINQRFSREIILVTGPMLDPRQAYEASDIVLGMGSSALRGMAFAKPLVVQGANGFWRLLEPESAHLFLWQGLYSESRDVGEGLNDILEKLIADPSRLPVLGDFGRALVEDRFNLDHAATKAISILEQAMSEAGTVSKLASLTHSAASYGKCLAHDFYRRIRAP